MSLSAQWSGPLSGLKSYLLQKGWKDSAAGKTPLYDMRGLNYLGPVYRNVLNFQPGKKNALVNYQVPANEFCLAGDHKTAIQLASDYYDSLPVPAYKEVDRFVDTLKAVTLHSAKDVITERTKHERMVMLNASPAYSQQRAFIYSLLDDLYNQGFRYLALEWLNSRKNRNVTSVDMFNGYFAAEPVAGEIMRKALQLGFRIVAYEDSLSERQDGSGRDAMQAATLANLYKHDSAAKCILIAGGGHISEKKIGNSYTPMAVFFKRFSGIDPLTIDLTEVCEGSAFEYGRYFFTVWSKKNSISQPSIAFRDKAPYSLLENDQYDLQVILPPTVWSHRRPSWLDLNGKRKSVSVRPTEKTLFLVQAYYNNETIQKPLPILIPADQTYVTDEDGYYWLYLLPGKYRLIFRDMDYVVIAEKELDVAG
ncbi:hypothetical protein FPE01S_07_00220 [Flavihumibacter petaseus NBRC 106054]|uniref:Uncharacterized protein n=1 Tax=Flavihumibacter petaseus NBRC 106054 TaxID=1220578 RepID=A0A0E9N730_9BACT|nr:hypothetical protein FPE01S_07_00220 [Flavihumibacter petaseus NBRC 106054]